MASHSSKKNHNGPYIPRDGAGAAKLRVAGKDTKLKLVGRQTWNEIWKGIGM